MNEIEQKINELSQNIWWIDGQFSMEDPQYEKRNYKDIWFEKCNELILQFVREIAEKQRESDLNEIEDERAEPGKSII